MIVGFLRSCLMSVLFFIMSECVGLVGGLGKWGGL